MKPYRRGKNENFTAAVLTLACAYGALLLFARLFAERIIFPAPPASYSDGGDIIYLGLPRRRKGRRALDSRQGFQNLRDIQPRQRRGLGRNPPALGRVRAPRDFGFRVRLSRVWPELRKAVNKGFEDSAEAAYRHVSEKLGFGDSDIAVVGYSLGSAAACEIASRHPGIRCAVIIGGFSKADKGGFARKYYTVGNARQFFQNIMQFKFPALFMHGRRDMVVPFRNALENYKAAPRGLGRLAVFPDRGHYGLPDSPKYWDEAVGFILSGGRPNRNDKL